MRAALLSPVIAVLALACAPPEELAPDAGPDRFADYGEPIAADDLEWTQVPFEEAKCGDGSSVGIVVNPSSASTKVLFYLEGGGACWDRFTCDQGIAGFVRSGIPQAAFDDFIVNRGQRGVFNRANEDNPFKDFSFVYVPYCTGDVHGGVVGENTYNVQHVGYDNIGHYLHRVVPTFPDATEVVLAGISAGGYGVTLNYDRVAEAFIDLPVHALVDSAPPLGSDVWSAELAQIQDTAWGISQTNPDFCTDGETDLCTDVRERFFRQVDAYPEARTALITTTGDETLRFFFGLGRFPPTSLTIAEYTAGVSDLIGEIAPLPNAEMYVMNTTAHTFLGKEPLGLETVNGTFLVEWLRRFVDDDRFGTVIP